MPTYMIQGNYTTESWINQVSNPANRVELARKAIADQGGKLIADYLCLGEYDFVLIMEMPDDETATGMVLSFICAGHLKNTKTTKLLDGDQGVVAMKKAASMKYQGTN